MIVIKNDNSFVAHALLINNNKCYVVMHLKKDIFVCLQQWLDFTF